VEEYGGPAATERSESVGAGEKGGNREKASSIVTAGATANTTEGNSRASRESGLLCSYSHGGSIRGCGCVGDGRGCLKGALCA